MGLVGDGGVCAEGRLEVWGRSVEDALGCCLACRVEFRVGRGCYTRIPRVIARLACLL